MRCSPSSRKLVLLLELLIIALIPHISAAIAAPTTFTATADAHVSSASRNANFGTSPVLEIQNGKQSKIAYLRFDLPNLQAPLNSATLRLHAAAADACSSGAGVEVYRAASTQWGEQSITWKKQPGSTGSRLSAGDGYAAGSSISWDVTARVSALGGPAAFVLKMPTCGSSSNSFGSRESANKPQLVIDAGDTSPPNVTITDPAGAGDAIARSYTVKGTAQDNVAVARVDVAIDGGQWYPASCSGCGTGQASWSTDLRGMPPGPHVIAAKAFDPADNASAVAEQSVTVVDTAPTVTIAEPREGGSLSSSDATARGGAEDDHAIDRVEISVHGGVWTSASCSGCGTSSVTWSHSLDGIAPGSHTLSAKSFDSAGKSSEEVSRGFTVVDSSPPPPGCHGVHLYPGADLRSAINGTTNTTFCIHGGTYDLGNSSIHPGRGDKLIGDDVTITGTGRVDAPTKLVSTATNGVIDFTAPASNVLIENLDISGAMGDGTCKPMCGRGINGHGGNVTDLTVRNSRIHHNASNGIGGAKRSLLVNVELDRNGATAFLGCCSGGVKIVHPYTIRESYIHHNIGNGAWQDVCGTDFVVVYNTVTYNTRSGIRYEHNQDCPGNATIKYNTIQNNNTEGKSTDAGGVAVNSAPNAEIAFNTFGGNQVAGIVVGGTRGPYTGTYIHDNTMNGDAIKSCTLTGVVCENNS